MENISWQVICNIKHKKEEKRTSIMMMMMMKIIIWNTSLNIIYHFFNFLKNNSGGQDDLISIWAFRGRIIARCQGHTSWVTSIAFDPYMCSDRKYRFARVGDDGKICFWDFSVQGLHRPKSLSVSFFFLVFGCVNGFFKFESTLCIFYFILLYLLLHY